MRIVLGYGQFRGCTLAQIPGNALQELADRFPLKSDNYTLSDNTSLLFAVGIHEELRRREVGGAIVKRLPTSRELASQMVAKGFQQLSRTHHPDRNGSSDVQIRLAEVRDILLNSCKDIPEDETDALVIPEQGVEISDDDIPF